VGFVGVCRTGGGIEIGVFDGDEGGIKDEACVCKAGSAKEYG